MKAGGNRIGEVDALQFNALPQRAKEIYFEYLEKCYTGEYNETKGVAFAMAHGFYIPEECKSPIEQIFYFAFSIVAYDRESGNIPGYIMEPQIEIRANGSKYFADFVFNYYGGVDSDYYLDAVNDLWLIVECDGHDFHKLTKAQVSHDNERDYDLKMAGYDVLHYSGSQIYNDPLKCAKEVHDYITQRTGGWRRVPVGVGHGKV